MGHEPDPVGELLSQVYESRGAASPELIEKLYSQLKGLARQMLANERSNHTLQSTALVHEACIRLLSVPDDKSHAEAGFVALARKVMRQILIDHARARNCEKRGGSGQNSAESAGGGDIPANPAAPADPKRWNRVPLDAVHAATKEEPSIILDLDEALSRLSLKNGPAAEVVEHRFFMALTTEETARAMGIPVSKVNELWRMARAWLFDELSDA